MPQPTPFTRQRARTGGPASSVVRTQARPSHKETPKHEILLTQRHKSQLITPSPPHTPKPTSQLRPDRTHVSTQHHHLAHPATPSSGQIPGPSPAHPRPHSAQSRHARPQRPEPLPAHTLDPSSTNAHTQTKPSINLPRHPPMPIPRDPALKEKPLNTSNHGAALAHDTP